MRARDAVEPPGRHCAVSIAHAPYEDKYITRCGAEVDPDAETCPYCEAPLGLDPEALDYAKAEIRALRETVKDLRGELAAWQTTARKTWPRPRVIRKEEYGIPLCGNCSARIDSSHGTIYAFCPRCGCEIIPA